MTVGGLATFFNREFGIGVELIVARTANWRRSHWFADTGLPWRNPSPNLRSPAALNNYPGTVYFEGTNLTEGRGTDRPFEQVGAPWLDAPAIVNDDERTPHERHPLRSHHDGRGTPAAAKFPGQTIPALRFVVTDARPIAPCARRCC